MSSLSKSKRPKGQCVSGEYLGLMTCVEEAYDELKATLENVDEDCPLLRPDTTPPSAKPVS